MPEVVMDRLTFTPKQFGALMGLLGEMLSAHVTKSVLDAIDIVDPGFATRINPDKLLDALKHTNLESPNETLLTIQILSVFADTDPGLTASELANFLGLKYEDPESGVVTAEAAALYVTQMSQFRDLIRSIKH